MKSNANKFFAYIISFCICMGIIKGYLITTTVADIIEIFNKEAIKDFITVYIKSEGFVNKYGSNYFYTNHISTKAFIIDFVNANNWSTLLNTEMTPEQMAVIVSLLFDAYVDKAILNYEWKIAERVLVFFSYLFYSVFQASLKRRNRRLM